MKPKVEALIEQIDSGKALNNDALILRYIKDMNGSYLERMRDTTGIPHQTLTASLSRLEDFGLIYVAGYIKGRKRNYSFYKFEEVVALRKVRSEGRQDVKLTNILKRIKRDFSDIAPDSLLSEIENHI